MDDARRDVSLTRRAVLAVVVILLVVGAIGTALWLQRPRLSEETVRDAVYSTIQREAPASFLVTGYIDVTTVTRVANTRTLLPGILGLELGTNTATVRVPGRISYGFDVRALQPSMIRLVGGDTVEVQIPDVSIYSIEPNLTQMELETRRGWARISESTREQVRDRAIELVQQSMRTQGQRHLGDSRQPRINTAEALYRMLRPVLLAAGMEDPHLRFRIGRSITIEPGRD